VDGTATSVIKRRQVEQPSLGVPGPASNRTVHDGSPDESENQRRHQLAALESTTDHDLHGDDAEEALEQGEQDLRQVSDGFGSHVLEADMAEISNEPSGSRRVGQSVSADPPLKRDDSRDQEGLPEQR